MRRLDGIIFCAIATLAACGGSQESHAAKHSLYDADYTIVYTAALEATRTLYPTLDEHVGPGRIQTAWHQVLFGGNNDDGDMNQRMTIPAASMVPGMTGGAMPGMGMASPAASAGGMPSQLTNKRYFVRFDVSVIGGRPWRVKVVGHASEWEPGAAMPNELHGIARPAWLDPRIEALQAAIYRRLKTFAVPMKEEVKLVDPDDSMPKTDPSSFASVPAPAGKLLATIKDLLARRDYTGLRAQLADDVVWSLGGEPSADTAMAMWQADPSAFEAMAVAVSAKNCANDDAKHRVTCSSGEHGWALVIEPRGAAWKVTSFVKPE